MTDHHWGVKGWSPSWYRTVEDLVSALAQANLIGSTIENTWTLWSESGWFEDAPVVLETKKSQIEFCAHKIGDFSMTLDSIDIQAPVNWCEEPIEFSRLKWCSNKHPELISLLGKKITDVGAIEYQLDNNIRGILDQERVLSGVFIRCASEYAEIFNGLDCNGLTSQPDSNEGLRYFSSAA